MIDLSTRLTPASPCDPSPSRMRTVCHLFVVGCLLLLAGRPVAWAQTIRYVKPGGTGNGSSWASASGDLQAMIATSNTGGQVWVAGGTYKPTSSTARNASFAMRNRVGIYGGFVGTETALSQRPPINPASGHSSSSVFSGDIGVVGDNRDNSYHVIYNPAGLNNTALLDGFVITGGNANRNSFPDYNGGGVYDVSSSPSFVNCTFQNNTARNSGGAMSNYNNSSPKLTNCAFQNNIASLTGGAIINSGVSPQLTNCLFAGNFASNGGAMYNNGSVSTVSSPQLTNCVFLNNTAGNGAVMFNNGDNSGVSSPQLTNCSFQGNSASYNGGVLFNSGSNSGLSNPKLSNCAVWNNGGAKTFYNSTATVSASYSLFDNTVTGYSSGPGNLSATSSPFVSTTSVALFSGSAALNTGDPTSQTVASGPYSTTALPATDIEGNLRIVGCRVDRGAVEYQNFTLPTRLYVAASQTASVGDGLSWATAFPDLQSALAYACPQRVTEIWVAQGLYKPTSTTARTVSFVMTNGVGIYGGFVGNETALNQRPRIDPVNGSGGASQPSSSTLSGDIGTVGNNSDNSYHVISNPAGLTATALLDGFVITGGNANGSGNNNTGGGVFNDGSGSGHWCSPSFQNCSFLSNTASADGGAMYNTGFGFGESSPQLTNCLFLNNNASLTGGAIYNNGSLGESSPGLTNCVLQANTANNGGGAMYNYGFNGTSRPGLTNCSFLSNTVVRAGGAIYSDGRSSGVATVGLTNCVFWNNGGGNTFFNASSTATVSASYSLFDNTVTGYTSGPGNLTVTTSPFLSATSVALQACSPALNSGNPASQTVASGPYSATALPATDLRGNTRIVGGRVDMGAVEYQQITGRLYVSAGQTVGAGDGLSWATAFPDLQTALSYSCIQSVTEIWVAAGTYKPTSGTDRTVGFAMKNGVAIYGGFRGTENQLSQRPAINPVNSFGGASQPSSSTLSGDIGTVGDNSDNSYHVISNPAGLTVTALLDGFVITGANANGSGNNGSGGGVLNDGSGSGHWCSPSFRNCLFQGNSAGSGAALCNVGDDSGESSPVLTNCAFQANSVASYSYGGAIYNSGYNGRSIPQLTNCLFLNNTAGYGGAMYNDGYGGMASPVLTNCAFLTNSASAKGGAIYNDGYSGTSSPQLINCSFMSNNATNGGAMYSDGSSSGVASPGLTNCVLWNNGGVYPLAIENASVTASYSLFDASVSGYNNGPGNLTTTTSPFASTTSMALRANSPAINAGNPASQTVAVGPYSATALPATDLTGSPRIVGGRVDMGAVEYSAVVGSEIYTVKVGVWGDASVWSVGRVPQAGERVRIRHVVQVSDPFAVGQIVYEANGQLVYSAGGQLQTSN